MITGCCDIVAGTVAGSTDKLALGSSTIPGAVKEVVEIIGVTSTFFADGVRGWMGRNGLERSICVSDFGTSEVPTCAGILDTFFLTPAHVS